VNCAEFKEHVAAYAIGALDGDERQACDEHLRLGQHEGCLEELGRMNATAHSLAESLPPVKPGGHVWKGIEDRIGREGTRAEGGGGGRRWRELVAWTVAVAAIFLIWFLLRKKDDLEQRVADLESQRMLAQADAREQERLKGECRTELAKAKVGDVQRQVLAAIEQQGTKLAALGPFSPDVTGFGGNVVMNADQKLAYLVGQGFKPQPGKTYQLWVIQATKPELKVAPAGFASPEPEGSAVAPYDAKLFDTALGFAVSIEDVNDDVPDKPNKVLLYALAPK
jgi:hypothetical protein